MKITFASVVIASFIAASFSNASFADTVCLKSIIKNGKIQNSTKVVALGTKCPSGYLRISSTELVAGPVGPAGSSGTQGPQGVAGPPGSAGANADNTITLVQGQTSDKTSTDSKILLISCPAQTQLVACDGGVETASAATSTAPVSLSYVGPNHSGSCVIRGYESTSTASSWGLFGTALCAKSTNVAQVIQAPDPEVEKGLIGNLNASSTNAGSGWPAVSLAGTIGSSATFADVNAISEYSTVIEVFDSLGAQHQITVFFLKQAANSWQARAYVVDVDVDPVAGTVGLPRQLSIAGGSAAASTFSLQFDSAGQLVTSTSTSILNFSIPWNNGSTTIGNQTYNLNLSNLTQVASASDITIGTIENGN